MGDRWDMAADALDLAGFAPMAAEVRGGRFYPRTTVRMLRWALHYYAAERSVMAKALKCAKALAREVRRG